MGPDLRYACRAMRFDSIPLAAGVVTVNPRTTPASVPRTACILAPPTLTGSDQAPSSIVLTLEGTTANTAVVEVWHTDEQGLPVAGQVFDPAAVFWYLGRDAAAATTVTVTVGALSANFPCLDGRMYFRVTTAPAAAATLKIGYSGINS